MKEEILAEMKLTFRAVFWVRNPRSLLGLFGLAFDALVLVVIAYGLFQYLWPTLFVLLVFFVLLPVFLGALGTFHRPLKLTSLDGRIAYPLSHRPRVRRSKREAADASSSSPESALPTPGQEPHESKE